MIIDFSNPWVFFAWYIITAIFLFTAYKLKKSIFALVTAIYFLVILGITAKNPLMLYDITIHRVFNFLGLAVGLSMYLVINEIETRRKVITKVFKNRYKKAGKGLKDETSEDSLDENSKENNDESKD